ncbi:hypothetical protein B8W67_19795 [Mycolicibacillus koreensis]|uniref:Uncharacterized protein n=1 Tax=Mycolicibacillus koreensis TaxID=1069220 RepID=A0AA91SPR8_9MYCO|nr:hypothetical protein B8W67_19795 [Mycolicibacillus koreensis]
MAAVTLLPVAGCSQEPTAQQQSDLRWAKSQYETYHKSQSACRDSEHTEGYCQSVRDKVAEYKKEVDTLTAEIDQRQSGLPPWAWFIIVPIGGFVVVTMGMTLWATAAVAPEIKQDMADLPRQLDEIERQVEEEDRAAHGYDDYDIEDYDSYDEAVAASPPATPAAPTPAPPAAPAPTPPQAQPASTPPGGGSFLEELSRRLDEGEQR